jgi:hypothetical protein
MDKPIMLKISPSAIDTITIDDVEYTRLTIDKDRPLIENNTLVINSNIYLVLFKEYFIKGKIPFYVEYDDIVSIFTNMKDWAGASSKMGTIPFELLTSIITRDAKDIKNYIRQVAKGDTLGKYEYVSLSDVKRGFNNTVSKITGAYLKDGINSALVNQSDTPTEIESYLLK